ncbi:hypothetical protein NIES4101_53560 [Calothrix sp. NIES-4101]|nr:hypothetical protein NIES4101_53560 [Calothrix sp. NIES-4101]
MYNTTVYSALPTATREGKGIEAVLLEYDISGNAPKPLWVFLVNPSSLRFSKSAKYTDIYPLAAKQSEVQYQASEGQTLSISNLKMTTWYYGKSLRPLLEGLQKLIEADIKNKKYAPPILKFQMGSREFAPCVLSKIEWEETAWLGGEPATITLGIELKEVAKTITRGQIEKAKEKKGEEKKSDRERAEKPRVKLTQRQRAAASELAKKYLESNVAIWDSSVQAAVKSKKYKLSTSEDTGEVTATGVNGAKLGVVAKSTGTEFLAGDKNTTIATLKGKKAPVVKEKVR